MFSTSTIFIGLAVIAVSGLTGWFVQRRAIPERGVRPFVVAATAVVVIANAAYAVWRYFHFEAHAFDLGIFDQALWHLSRFEAPASTIRGVSNLFGDHFHPIIAVLVPFYWIFRSPIVLIVAQAVLFASVVPLSFLLARTIGLAAWPAAVLGLAFGLNPGFTPALGFDFHEIAFAVPLLMLTLLFIERRNWRWYWVTIAALLLTKESLPMYTLMIGVFLLFRRSWRPGIATVGVSIVGFFLITRLIIPTLSDTRSFGYWEQYERLAPSPSRLPLTMVQHPARFITVLFDDPEKVETQKWMFASVGYLPILSWTTLPLVYVGLAEHFLTDNAALWRFQFHYQVMMAVVMAIAALYAVRDLNRFVRWRNGLPAAIAVLVLLMTFWVHTKTESIRILWNNDVRARPVALWQKELRAIPRNAAVSVQDAFVPRLSERAAIYRFPIVNDAEWIVLDPRAPSFPLRSDEVEQWQATLRNDPDWRLVRQVQTFTGFRRQLD